MSLEARVLELENELRKVKEQLQQLTPVLGEIDSYHKSIDMDGYYGTLAQVLEHGLNAASGQTVDKACLRIGSSPTTGLYAQDRIGSTGAVGMGKGNSGYFLSKVDSLTAGQTVAVVSS